MPTALLPLVSSNPMDLTLLRASLTPKTVRQIIQTGTQLATIKQTHPRELIGGLILLLKDLNDNFNIARPLSDAQMGSIAGVVLRQWWYLKIEEVVYVLEQGKVGKYGSVFEGLDMNKISGWFIDYDTKERLALCEANRHTKAATDTLDQETLVAAYQKMAAGGQLDTHAYQQEQARRPRLVAQNVQDARVEAHKSALQMQEDWFKAYPEAQIEDYVYFLQKGTVPEHLLSQAA